MPAPGLTTKQQSLDATVAEWPGVHPKLVFGHRGYVVHGKMIGFLADEGAAVKVSGPEGDSLYALDGVHAFTYGTSEMRGWPVLPLRDAGEVDATLSVLRAVYERATEGAL